MGAYTQPKSTIAPGLERVYEQFPRLKERRRQVAGTLSGGEQQMLAMGRALMSNPKLLMLDEPSMGLAPILIEQIFQIVEDLHKAGTTILLVEQNAQMAWAADASYHIVPSKGGIASTGGVAFALRGIDLFGPGTSLSPHAQTYSRSCERCVTAREGTEGPGSWGNCLIRAKHGTLPEGGRDCLHAQLRSARRARVCLSMEATASPFRRRWGPSPV